MAAAYIIAAVVILILNYKAIPGAVVEIVQSAFGMRAVAGGAHGAMMLAMQKGIARGIFSNEAGIGSAPIAAAAVQTTEPVRQGLVSMLGTVIDTIIICTMTGLYNKSIPGWTSFPCKSIRLYLNALPCILCIYYNSWMGLLQ